jgi:hypothetical protein
LATVIWLGWARCSCGAAVGDDGAAAGGFAGFAELLGAPELLGVRELVSVPGSGPPGNDNGAGGPLRAQPASAADTIIAMIAANGPGRVMA